MALVNKRIIDLPERAELNSDDYTVVDGSNGGTAKYKLSKMQEDITTVDQDVEQLSGTVTQHGQQLTTINQTVTQNTSDITDLKEDLKGKATVIINTSDEAEVVTFSDGADGMPLKSMTFDFEENQSGYTSINVTRAGKNLLKTVTPTYSGLTIVKNSDGSFNVEGTPASNGSIYFWNDANNPIVVPDNAILTTNYNPNGKATFIFGTKESATALQTSYSDTLNVPAGEYTAFRIYVSRNHTYDFTLKPMIRLASIADGTYEPFVEPTIYPITLPQTVYGGEITINNPGITTLLGSNTIWMSADGTLQADYPADTKMYIDALTAPDDDMIADSNIASGKYFTVNNRLYLSTSAIAQGEQIIVGTNCTQTDLATALNAINA